MQNSTKAYTVSAVTRMIKSKLEENFQSIWIEGELSSYAEPVSGHKYATIKDGKSVLKIIIWRNVAAGIKFKPEVGQKVLVHGDITVYEQGGYHQLNCKKIKPVGIGELELALRQLYAKLKEEGLFDKSLRKPIPSFATKIGVVTSATGAAIHDIINITRRRNKTVNLKLYPSKVQGDGAEDGIKAGIEYFNKAKNVDLIIIGRGGGSQEDLWSFNSEKVVRAIFDSELPVISAVGHEIDTSLSDLVADLKAPTPSAAAELAVWSLDEFRQSINDNIYQQASIIEDLLLTSRERLIDIMRRPVFSKPVELIYQKSQTLDNLIRILKSSGKNSFDLISNRLSLVLAKLDSLSPLKILERGYSVSRKPADKSVISSVAMVKKGETIETVVSDGLIISIVENSVERKLN